MDFNSLKGRKVHSADKNRSVHTYIYFFPNYLHSALNAQIALIFSVLRSVDTIKNRIHHCVHAPLHNASLAQSKSGFTA